MISHRAGIVSMAITLLSACAGSPQHSGPDRAQAAKPVALEKPEPATNDGVEGIHQGNDIPDISGIGTIVYVGRPLVKCGQLVRLGSRIRRELCNADGFNGMYPSGGINMGTALESQIPYGK